MRAPRFWWEPPGLAASLLRPASTLYGAVADRRIGRRGAVAALPVICVGNLTVGGSGKTPTALALAAFLRDRGRRPGFLLRGYGGRLAGPVLVEPARHGPAEVGDEALLLARDGPTVVARDRPAGAALLARLGAADVVVMDDGLQNPSLTKDLRLAVFDGAVGTGNGLVLPAGPLRASAASQWPLVHAAIVIGNGRAGEAAAAEAGRRGIPVVQGELVPDPAVAASLRGVHVLAFAGIGRPEKFFETLRALGAELAEVRAFADHHRYRRADAAALLGRAAERDLVLVTTDKDGVRLRALRADLPQIETVRELPVRLRFDDPAALGRVLGGARRLSPGG